MRLSAAVRRWYAERIFARGAKGQLPASFRPLEGRLSGRSVIEGCRGGGRNVLEVRLRVADGRIEAIQMACNLCSPAMYVAADILGAWALGREAAEVLLLDVYAEGTLTPLFDVLQAPERPADAGEKFRYALWAVQNALRNDRGEPSRPAPDFEGARDDSDRPEAPAPDEEYE